MIVKITGKIAYMNIIGNVLGLKIDNIVLTTEKSEVRVQPDMVAHKIITLDPDGAVKPEDVVMLQIGSTVEIYFDGTQITSLKSVTSYSLEDLIQKKSKEGYL